MAGTGMRGAEVSFTAQSGGGVAPATGGAHGGLSGVVTGGFAGVAFSSSDSSGGRSGSSGGNGGFAAVAQRGDAMLATAAACSVGASGAVAGGGSGAIWTQPRDLSKHRPTRPVATARRRKPTKPTATGSSIDGENCAGVGDNDEDSDDGTMVTNLPGGGQLIR
jgi:hypothetical protein